MKGRRKINWAADYVCRTHISRLQAAILCSATSRRPSGRSFRSTTIMHIFFQRNSRTTSRKSKLVRGLTSSLVLFSLLLVTLPSPASARQTNSTDELAELRHELQAIAARIDALEKKKSETGLQSATGTGGPSGGDARSSSTVSTQPLLERQESAVVPSAKPAKAEPFAFADWTWLTGNPRTKEPAFDSKFFTPEIRADVDYIVDFNHPKDDTIGGSSEVFRSSEVQLTQLGVGGDFHYDNVRAGLMTQFGMYSQTQPRNDASPSRGQWNLSGAYQYLSEAYGGYHFDALHGVNV